MKVFTYFEYIKVIHKLRLNAVLQLAEESESYELEGTKQEKVHDKLIKHILEDKMEMSKFINQYLEPKEKVKEEELIRYTNSYMNEKYKGKEADLVYKLKDKEVYFLIEHQSTIDNNMPFRMLNYCINIMQEWSRNRKIRKNTNYPIVVPILIYTGKIKWDIKRNFKEKQIGDYVFENYMINYEFNIVDINKITGKELLKNRSMFSYGILIEKSKSKEELKNNLDIIIKKCNKKKHLEEIENIILYLLKDILNEAEQDDLLGKIKRKVGEEKMSEWLDSMIAKNSDVTRSGRLRTARNMVRENFEDKVILKITEITKRELRDIKQEIAVAK